MGKNERNAVTAFICVLAGFHLFSKLYLCGFYTPTWAQRTIYWIVCVVLLIPAVHGKMRFSITAFLGYLAGLLLGELLGKYEEDVPPQYAHHGWWILILTFLASCVLGGFLQKRANREN